MGERYSTPAGPGEAWPLNAFLCNLQPKIWKSVKVSPACTKRPYDTNCCELTGHHSRHRVCSTKEMKWRLRQRRSPVTREVVECWRHSDNSTDVAPAAFEHELTCEWGHKRLRLRPRPDSNSTFLTCFNCYSVKCYIYEHFNCSHLNR